MSKVKLLIEIDEPVYISLKMRAEQKDPVCCTENAYLIQKIIDGTVITDDCISREALKTKFHKSCCGNCSLCGYYILGNCTLVSNAPTIGGKEYDK